jgi:hypothetical protein
MARRFAQTGAPSRVCMAFETPQPDEAHGTTFLHFPHPKECE